MDKKEFIESGILESYVMGLASPPERREVEHMLARYPEIKDELAVIEKSLERYAISNQLTPKNETKARVMQIIGGENETVDVPVKTVPINKSVSATAALNWLSIAASVVLFVSIGLNLYLYSRLSNTREDLISLRQERNAFASEVKVQQSSLQKMNDDMKMMAMPGTQKVMMKGMEKTPDALATVYWNNDTKDVMLTVQSMPAPPADMQYQLWAIVDGKPVDAGVFDMMPAGGMVKMKSISGAVAFAVTLEKKGGSPVPTMSNMFVMGKV